VWSKLATSVVYFLWMPTLHPQEPAHVTPLAQVCDICIGESSTASSGNTF
jgi:hypothetical protein